MRVRIWLQESPDPTLTSSQEPPVQKLWQAEGCVAALTL